jgi:1-acyl-sn-glycerol-3-phosphate acyltransferase
MIPVDRDGASDIRAIRCVLKLLQEGQGITVFPEGTRSPDGQFKAAQPGIGLLACRASVPVIPVRVFGTYEIWNRHQTKPNFHRRSQCVVGPPMWPQIYDPGKEHPQRYLECAQRIMKAIRDLQLPTLQRV